MDGQNSLDRCLFIVLVGVGPACSAKSAHTSVVSDPMASEEDRGNATSMQDAEETAMVSERTIPGCGNTVGRGGWGGWCRMAEWEGMNRSLTCFDMSSSH